MNASAKAFCFLLALATSVAGQSSVFIPKTPPDLITFDDLLAGAAVPTEYSNYCWIHFNVVDGAQAPAAVVSPHNVAGNDSGLDATISSKTRFCFLSLSMTAAPGSPLAVEARGYFGGVLLYDATNTLTDAASVFWPLNFGGVDAVTFSAADHSSFFVDNVSLAGIDSISGAPVITSQPRPVATFDTNAVFTVGAAGSAPLSYQWFSGPSVGSMGIEPIPRATNATFVNSASKSSPASWGYTFIAPGPFTVVVSNAYGCVTSVPAAFVGLAAMVEGYNDLGFDDLPSGSRLGFYGGFTWSNFTALDAVSYPDPSAVGSGMVSSPNVLFDVDGGPARITFPTPLTKAEVFLSAMFQDNLRVQIMCLNGGMPVFGQTATLSTSGSTLLVLEIPRNPPPVKITFDAVAFVPLRGTPRPGFPGTNTAFMLDDFIYQVPFTPIITTQPASQTVPWSASASFSAQGNAPMYLWKRNGAPITPRTGITGSASNVLVISNATTADAGSYTVVLSNDFYSATSQVARLTVIPPPPQLQSAGLSHGSLNVSWSALSGCKYQPQYATDLAKPHWLNFGLASTNASFSAYSGGRQTFYRVLVIPP